MLLFVGDGHLRQVDIFAPGVRAAVAVIPADDLVPVVPDSLRSLGHRDERKVRRDWELILTPKGEKLYHSIETRVSSEMELANLTYEEAFSVRELGSLEEAKLLTSTDPAVQAGRLAMEIHPWLVPVGVLP